MPCDGQHRQRDAGVPVHHGQGGREARYKADRWRGEGQFHGELFCVFVSAVSVVKLQCCGVLTSKLGGHYLAVGEKKLQKWKNKCIDCILFQCCGLIVNLFDCLYFALLLQSTRSFYTSLTLPIPCPYDYDLARAAAHQKTDSVIFSIWKHDFGKLSQWIYVIICIVSVIFENSPFLN